MKKEDEKRPSEQLLPRYVQDVLSRHDISLPSPFGEGSGVRLLALQAPRYPDIDMPFLLDQITGWQTARTKLPSWVANEDILYPPHLSMEQCSSEQTAMYKARLANRLADSIDSVSSSALADSSSPSSTSTPFSVSSPSSPSAYNRLSPHDSSRSIQPHSLTRRDLGRFLCDLTGGFGVDFSFMARGFERAVYVERQEALCETARHNFHALGLEHVEVVNADGTEYLHQLAHASVIFLDPARRNEQGGKTVLISDCTPDVLALEEELLEKAGAVVIKLSPMLDWHRAVDELNRMGEVVREVHIVSVRNECKELLLVLRKGNGTAANVPADGLRMFCVNDDSIVSHGLGEVSGLSQHILPAAPAAGQYLYEPNASLMKAGCFALLTARYPLSALGQNTHLFVSDEDIAGFPGRKFEITAVSSFNKKELRRTLSGIDRANLSVRNFPMSVADLRRRMKMKEGGETYLFAATDAHGSHLLFVCRKI
ncbi:hypothetical protein HMPREF9303_2689 [Prevotella denticola CRIS 18C-A]|uniref:Uncharacterized protein n=1 Tax=Prevotella denticola CRIS 18C-A TaxID=944557 RepID=F0H937_9BACT|nr:class I SAM-dependent methyltransferase [Prevotella denticola]EGC85651.1 hypothetical protein HMPREF9303_2689 [Prevotella denticola CRIS 18C-A]